MPTKKKLKSFLYKFGFSIHPLLVLMSAINAKHRKIYNLLCVAMQWGCHVVKMIKMVKFILYTILNAMFNLSFNHF